MDRKTSLIDNGIEEGDHIVIIHRRRCRVVAAVERFFEDWNVLARVRLGWGAAPVHFTGNFGFVQI